MFDYTFCPGCGNSMKKTVTDKPLTEVKPSKKIKGN
jgi:hypothetical protein